MLASQNPGELIAQAFPTLPSPSLGIHTGTHPQHRASCSAGTKETLAPFILTTTANVSQVYFWDILFACPKATPPRRPPVANGCRPSEWVPNWRSYSPFLLTHAQTSTWRGTQS